jgi:hypothetical protein
MFAEAKALSTAQEQLRLDEVMRIIQLESQDSTWLNSTFLKLNCTVRADTAECACKIRDQDYTYNTNFLLMRIDGRWLVDAPDEEEILFDEEEIEASLDSFLNQSKK